MLGMSWKWKLNDKRTQDRYVEKGLVDKASVEANLKKLPDLTANATWVEIEVDDLQVDETGSEDNQNETDSHP